MGEQQLAVKAQVYTKLPIAMRRWLRRELVRAAGAHDRYGQRISLLSAPHLAGVRVPRSLRENRVAMELELRYVVTRLAEKLGRSNT